MADSPVLPVSPWPQGQIRDPVGEGTALGQKIMDRKARQESSEETDADRTATAIERSHCVNLHDEE